MFNILKQASTGFDFPRKNSTDNGGTTAQPLKSELAITFENFIQRNQDTWLNKAEEICFDYLTNKDKQRQVILDRQSITYQQSSGLLKMAPKNLKDLEGVFNFELETVFQDLASKYSTTEPQPRLDIIEGFNFRPHGHPHDNLASKGFNQEELINMSLADAIIYDAVIFSAQSWAGHLNDCTPYLSNTEMAEGYRSLFHKVCETIEQKIIEKIRQFREIQLACPSPSSQYSTYSSLTSLETLSSTDQTLEPTENPLAEEMKRLKQELAEAETEQKLVIVRIELQYATKIQELRSDHAIKLQKALDQYQLMNQKQAEDHAKVITELEQQQNIELSRLKAEHCTNLVSAQQAKTQTEYSLETIKKATSYPNKLLSGLSYEILGGFIASIGISAVALAIATLSIASFGILPAAGIMVVGSLLATGGFFCLDKGAAQRVIETQYSLQHPF